MTSGVSRRFFLAGTAACMSAAAGCTGSGEKKSAMNEMLAELGANEAVAAMRRGELTAEAYASALLEKCQQYRHLNAFITLQPERVLEAARAADRLRASGAATGELHGLPVPVKDSVNTADYPTTGGTRALAEFLPARDAELIRRLKAAGAIVLGKTNLHELSFGWTSNNGAFGAVRNPYDTGRIPGGSSGGTAAAIAARLAPLGIAEDTQGSIRVPAALCGVYGFRPSQNRYPNQGVVPITPLFDQTGPHARNVEDLSLFDQVVTGEAPVAAPALEGLRLGVARAYYFADLDREVDATTRTALETLRAAGAVIVDADVPDLQQLIDRTTSTVQLYHAAPMLRRYLEESGSSVSFAELVGQLSGDVAASFAEYVLPGGAGTPSEADFVAARDRYLPMLRQTMRDYFASNSLDAMIFPATQITAPPIGQDTVVKLNGVSVPFEPAISRNISPGSTAGLPGLVIPIGLNSEGLPISLELDGPAGADRKILAAGLALERLFGRLPAPPHA